VEVPLRDDEELQFHSVFACPVTREQAKPSNPPMLLSCGHVVSRDAIAGLTSHRARFKCPTCPAVQTVKDLKELKVI
jgi:hypothetical protein